MNRRLLRALERGGVAAPIASDRWGVWRGRDRRTRMIGVLSGAEIDVLRVRDVLHPLGDTNPPLFICTRKCSEPGRVNPDSTALRAVLPDPSGPFVELVIARCSQPALRSLTRSTVQDYRRDVECAMRSPGISGMNWSALSLGGKVDGGRWSQNRRPSRLSTDARKVVDKLHRHLEPDDVDLLHRLTILEQTRSELSKRICLRPSLMEQRAFAGLRRLEEAYRRWVRRED